jgi:hypothetical protein
MKAQFSYITLLILTVFASFFIFGVVIHREPLWIVLVASVGALSWILMKRWGLPFVLLALCILVLEASGIRVYGSPRVEQVSLANPLAIERIETPNVLVLSDGSTRVLKGVVFKNPMALRVTPSVVAEWQNLNITWMDSVHTGSVAAVWGIARRTSRHDLKVGEEFEAEFPPLAGDDPVRGVTLIHFHYWCGNSFNTCFFPHDLPSAYRMDLAELFVRAGVAEPTGSDSDYDKELAFLASARRTP